VSAALEERRNRRERDEHMTAGQHDVRPDAIEDVTRDRHDGRQVREQIEQGISHCR
jgi:hypothetical protein